MRVALLGATGYTGIELLRLLANHPRAEVVLATSERYVGRPLEELLPGLGLGLRLERLDPERVEAEAALLCLPHGRSQEVVPCLLRRGVRVVDLSADFRLDASEYARWYGPHRCPELLTEAVYGLPELYRERIRGARLVANPGCYPTAVILGLAPLCAHRLIEPEVIVDAKSGASGAGRQPRQDLHFCEVNEDLRAYALQGHRHLPEMERHLSELAGQPVAVRFVPHLVPMSRGILATCYARLRAPWDEGRLRALFEEFYREEPFVRVLPPGRSPRTLEVRATNRCHIGLSVRDGGVVVLAAVDNLVKGASGQAVQNLNLMFDVPEAWGLQGGSLLP